MMWLRILIVAFVVMSAGLVTPTGTAEAAKAPETGGFCIQLDPETRADCLIKSTEAGSGGDLYIFQVNQCSGDELTCTQEVTLTGTFNKVVVERINGCTTGAICRNTLNVEGATIKILQFKHGVEKLSIPEILDTKIKNRCDATATCTNTVVR